MYDPVFAQEGGSTSSTVVGGKRGRDENLMGTSMRAGSGKSLGQFGIARTLHLMRTYNTASAAQTSMLPADWVVGNHDLGFFISVVPNSRLLILFAL